MANWCQLMIHIQRGDSQTIYNHFNNGTGAYCPKEIGTHIFIDHIELEEDRVCISAEVKYNLSTLECIKFLYTIKHLLSDVEFIHIDICEPSMGLYKSYAYTPESSEIQIRELSEWEDIPIKDTTKIDDPEYCNEYDQLCLDTINDRKADDRYTVKLNRNLDSKHYYRYLCNRYAFLNALLDYTDGTVVRELSEIYRYINKRHAYYIRSIKGRRRKELKRFYLYYMDLAEGFKSAQRRSSLAIKNNICQQAELMQLMYFIEHDTDLVELERYITDHILDLYVRHALCHRN